MPGGYLAQRADDPDSNLFYVVKYGIRFTAMPGWDGVLSDDDIWKAVLFIKNPSQMKDAAVPPNTQTSPSAETAPSSPPK